MDPVTVAAALVSAFLHASWNAAVKGAPDPRGAMAAQVVASGVVATPLLLIVSPPGLGVVPWLAASVLFNLLAILALLRGYAHGGFGFVYPLARSVSPLLVTLLARVLVGESLSLTGGLGVAMISGGVALFAIGRGRHRPAALAYALLSGAFSAAYAVCDAQGARLSPSVLGYATAVMMLNAVVFGTVHKLRHGSIGATLRDNRGVALFGSGAAMLSYVLILWVWDRAPVAVGSALRDTSIVFGALIAAVVLKEKMTRIQIGAVAVVTLGACVLRFT